MRRSNFGSRNMEFLSGVCFIVFHLAESFNAVFSFISEVIVLVFVFYGISCEAADTAACSTIVDLVLIWRGAWFIVVG